MVQSTNDLVAYFNTGKKTDYSIVRAYVHATLNCGTRADADALLACFLEKPDDSYRAALLKVIREFGDRSHAQQLAETCFRDGLLIENVSEEVLEVIGHFRYEPFKSVLAAYVFEEAPADYYTHRSAILGLLHFDCVEYRDLIQREIEKCYGNGLFPEFIPALVCKLEDRTELLEKLYDLGSNYASTDCISGIILGFSLCGEEGRAYFDRILFDSNWESCDGGTGAVVFTYRGLKNLGMRFSELYEQVRAVENEPELTFYMENFLALLELRINDEPFPGTESPNELFELLFSWENPNKQNPFWGLVQKSGQSDKAYLLEKVLIKKMTQTAILSNFRN